MKSFQSVAALSSLTFALAAQGAEPVPEVSAPKYTDPVCVVMLNRNKVPVTAHVHIRESRTVLFAATALTRLETGAEGHAQDGQGKDVGLLRVNATKQSDDRATSMKPLNCEVNGTAYPVVISDKLIKRLYTPQTP